MSLEKDVAALSQVAGQLERLLSDDHARALTFGEWLPRVSPGLRWDWPHIRYIRERLERIASGELRRLMVFCPPRHGKSELGTIHYPAWTLERWPTKRVVIACYNQALAERFSRRVRRIAAERMTLSDDRNTAGDWETAAGGSLRAVGVSGGITGHGADLIIVDDPVSGRDEVTSQAMRERVWNWWRDDLFTRLEPGGAIVVTLTRWHDDDLAGRILASESGKGWEVVSLPAIAEKADPLGRAEGEPLCPDRYDLDALEERRAVLGSASFEALFQQRPSAMEGAIFKRHWWKEYTERPHFTRIVQSWDTAFKAGESNDYSVCTTWGVAQDGFYLLDVWRRRAEFGELKRQAVSLRAQYRATAVLIEDKASGQSLIQELKRDTLLPVLAIKVDADKVSRAFAVTPTVESGRVFLPAAASWREEYITELASFPNAGHDDMVDSTTQALNYMANRPMGPPPDYSRGPGVGARYLDPTV